MILSRSIACRTDLVQLDDPLTYHEQYLATALKNEDSLKKSLSCLFKVLVIYEDDDRYKNSPRYLRLWITYVFYLNTRLIYPTFFGLIDNHIGDKLAVLYEAIAYQQLKEKRYQDVEATLLLGIGRNAQPLQRLDRILQDFKATKALNFDINHYTLESLASSAAQMDQQRPNKPSTKERLKDHLNLMNLKLQHATRSDALRQCYTRNCNYEELKAKTQYHGLINNTINMGQGIKKGGSCAVRGFTFYLQNPAIPVPAQKKEQDDHPQLDNVVQLPHKPGFIAQQLQLTGVIDRETYHLIDTSAEDIIIKLKDWSRSKSKGLIVLDKDSFHVVRLLGKGGLADVYLVQHSETLAYYGLKVQQPAHPWEYYILSQIHARESTDNNVPNVYDFYHYNYASFILMDVIQYGSLLDALNAYRPQKACMPEPIVLIIAMHLLDELIKLHGIHIVHNDLKLDNIMLMHTQHTTTFPKIIMIDFGYSIDVSALPPHSLCKANWPPAHPKSDYPKLNQPHSPYHADYWQLASMAHLLLYGTPMLITQSKNAGYSITQSKNAGYSIQQPIRRYWHHNLWKEFFKTLLNPVLHYEEKKLHELWLQFQHASQNIPQIDIATFTSMLQNRTFLKLQ